MHAARAKDPFDIRAKLRRSVQSITDGARRHVRRITHPVWLGSLRRTTPISDAWGYDRGTPVDRYFIEAYLDSHKADIRGRVLEVRDARYATKLGQGVTHVDVLDIDGSNPRATIVADLAHAAKIESDQFDCFVLTQTLQYIRDLPAALAHARRILRPGGVLLATLPAVQRLDPALSEADLWRFTPASCQALFEEAFGAAHTQVAAFGNVLSCVATLSGIAAQELPRRALRDHDPNFPAVICVRAVRSSTPADEGSASQATSETRPVA